MKIRFIRPAVPLGFAYAQGEEIDAEQALCDEFIAQGFAVKVDETTPSGLPADIPGLQALVAAGFNSIDEVKNCKDLKEINGIGDKTADAIDEYISKLG